MGTNITRSCSIFMEMVARIMPSMAFKFEAVWLLQVGPVIMGTDITRSCGISMETVAHVMPGMASK